MPLDHEGLKVRSAAVAFALADQRYVARIHELVHKDDDGKALVRPTFAELEELLQLQEERNQLENSFFDLWLDGDWRALRKTKR